MDASKLQNIIARGMGVAARKVGAQFTVFRPNGPNTPTDSRNRIIRLNAVFQSANGSSSQTAHAAAIWRGIFDSCYTRPGDYLVGADQTFFVGTSLPMEAPPCVVTNAVVDVVRPSFAAQGGYSGLYAAAGESVLTGWPASLIEDSGSMATVKAGSPSYGRWTVLLPLSACELRAGDVVTNQSGSSLTVVSAEGNLLGWKLLARQLAP